jgi:Lipocalin-like domain
MENTTRLIVIALVAALLAGVSGAPRAKAAAGAPLKGAWKAVNVGAGPNSRRAVGLAIFSDSHYSIMVFDAESERPDVADISKASAEEMRGLWAGWVANTGTYDVQDDLVTIHPAGAKIPLVMKSGATEVYRYAVDGGTLTWTQRRNARGVEVTNGATYTFVRDE